MMTKYMFDRKRSAELMVKITLDCQTSKHIVHFNRGAILKKEMPSYRSNNSYGVAVKCA